MYFCRLRHSPRSRAAAVGTKLAARRSRSLGRECPMSRLTGRDFSSGGTYSGVDPQIDTASIVPHGVPPSTREGWRVIEHRALKRRASTTRGPRRRRQRRASPVRDAFETWRSRTRAGQFLIRLVTILLATVAIADLIADTTPLRQASFVIAVLLAGAASLLAVSAAERAGAE